MGALKTLYDAAPNSPGGIASSTAGLDGFCASWVQASNNPAFKAAQDAAQESMYYAPSQRIAGEIGATLPLTQAFLYDSIVQHGEGTKKADLGGIIAATNAVVGGTPKSGVDEKRWLAEMINQRYNVLKTTAGWKGTESRVNPGFKTLVDNNNWYLTAPALIRDYSEKTVPGPLVTINPPICGTVRSFHACTPIFTNNSHSRSPPVPSSHRPQ